MSLYRNDLKRCARCRRVLPETVFTVEGFVRQVCADCRAEALRLVRHKHRGEPK